ncbi:translation initiation factor IF-3 [Candidatus Falkowbacteria bacterium RIFOXYD2_FULL_35_9]|uniref:Translation initiation factor IF-3 n=1 Tax=Candidatus Falkowbacteria bacterium RIFOXYC2_FULL_36_12 TaxID=1798002 RepID=A0A1F5SZ98_9BACT|nr:MAG: translation initiation factor IF-3 [Candidatus Falkowbacteria bacterium RIFOXYB2_FULL_35_7]OGF31783.1 MAG: translation initiation factor IF-3 [Candidatus Falkowbacteria bacterium RIFOXYC2_FULL_36_12]OGF48022.1 MAG: translation initiation factor IF-3 [Candidatus Falkowbacteria bacterium RIFOXYD2_FULL_35_9]
MRKSYKFAKRKKETQKYKMNRQIKAEVVQVIDHEGTFLGEMKLMEAIEQAEDLGLDLIEVNPNVTPPITKFINFGSFKYKQEKLAREQKMKQKKIETKGIRLSPKISEHDQETRINQTKKFLEKGNKVRLEMILRGREFQHMDKAKEQIREFTKKLDTPHIIEQNVEKKGNKLTMIIIPENSKENK